MQCFTEDRESAFYIRIFSKVCQRGSGYDVFERWEYSSIMESPEFLGRVVKIPKICVLLFKIYSLTVLALQIESTEDHIKNIPHDNNFHDYFVIMIIDNPVRVFG